MHSLQTNELTENEFQHNFYGYKITENFNETSRHSN